MRHELKRLSRKMKIAMAVVVILAAVISAATYKTYDYIENNPNFCRSCHIMEGPFAKWQDSPHHMVNCHECHKQSRLDSLHQAWMYVIRRPKEVVHHPNLDHKVCAQCHLSRDSQWKLIGNTSGHKVHFEKAGIECLDCHMQGVHEFIRPVDSCGTCHSDKTETGDKMAFVHCLQCHNFLASGEELKPTSAACKSCHDRIQTDKPHLPVSKGAECIACHKPHEMNSKGGAK